jgi:hypothetical protein
MGVQAVIRYSLESLETQRPRNAVNCSWSVGMSVSVRLQVVRTPFLRNKQC